ncbi:MAG: replicative DNA helicase [Phycisphaerae bacterium]
MSTLPTTSRPRPLTLEGGGGGGDTTIERLPPHDQPAEVAVLGSMIIDPTVIGPVCMILPKADVFFFDKHQVLYSVIVELFEKNTPMDPLVIASTLKSQNQLDAIGGLNYLTEVLGAVPTAAHAEYYAGIVKEKAMLRSLIQACSQTLRDVYESGETAAVVLDRGEKRIFDIAQQKASNQAVPLTDALHETFAILDRNGGEHLSGLATGYAELDNLTSGLQKGEMLILAARPSVGKTALAMNIAEYVSVDQGRPVAVFSLEMSKQQLAQRLLCSRSGVDGHRLRRGMLSSQDRHALSEAVGKLSQGKMFIDDSPGLTLMDLRTKARRLKLQHGIEMIVIDYLQLMEAPREENRQQQIGSISRGIKALARELNVPVICLSQLNRASESEQRLPRTSDLRESGSIEQDADVVMLLHREAVMHRGDQEWADANPDKLNEAILIIAKQRNGPCDNVKMTFLSGSTRFVNWNPG